MHCVKIKALEIQRGKTLLVKQKRTGIEIPQTSFLIVDFYAIKSCCNVRSLRVTERHFPLPSQILEGVVLFFFVKPPKHFQTH